MMVVAAVIRAVRDEHKTSCQSIPFPAVKPTEKQARKSNDCDTDRRDPVESSREVVFEAGRPRGVSKVQQVHVVVVVVVVIVV